MAQREERKWEALWSYRANPPIVGEGASRMAVPFPSFLAELGLGDEEVAGPKPPEITDDEMKRMMAAGKMGLDWRGLR